MDACQPQPSPSCCSPRSLLCLSPLFLLPFPFFLVDLRLLGRSRLINIHSITNYLPDLLLLLCPFDLLLFVVLQIPPAVAVNLLTLPVTPIQTISDVMRLQLKYSLRAKLREC